MRTHPHAEASYRVVLQAGGEFAVEVKIPDAAPTMVSSFATEADAEAWIARNKERVAAEGQAGTWFKRSPGNRGRPPGRAGGYGRAI